MSGTIGHGCRRQAAVIAVWNSAIACRPGHACKGHACKGHAGPRSRQPLFRFAGKLCALRPRRLARTFAVAPHGYDLKSAAMGRAPALPPPPRTASTCARCSGQSRRRRSCPGARPGRPRCARQSSCPCESPAPRRPRPWVSQAHVSGQVAVLHLPEGRLVMHFRRPTPRIARARPTPARTRCG